jgi:putative membrane protein
MIAYNPKEWFTFIFRLHKADTIQKLTPMMIAIAIYGGLIAYLELDFFQLDKESVAKNITVVHSLLGFVLSLLLVFRTNTAYDRWWEGRRLWGSLVNSSRNLSIKLDALLDTEDKENRIFFAETIGLYANTLSAHLSSEEQRLILDEIDHPELKGMDQEGHLPNKITALLINKVNNLVKDKVILPEHLLFINNDLSAFTDVCGACERIKNTPIPFSYSSIYKEIYFLLYHVLPFRICIFLKILGHSCFGFYVLCFGEP